MKSCGLRIFEVCPSKEMVPRMFFLQLFIFTVLPFSSSRWVRPACRWSFDLRGRCARCVVLSNNYLGGARMAMKSVVLA